MNMNIGEYVSSEKEARGLTLEKLHEMTGIRPQHLSRLIKHPPKTPDSDTVQKFALAFQVHPAEIWKKLSSDLPQPAMTLDQRISARISRHLAALPPDKQERAVNALERTAQDFAEMATA